MIKLKHVYECQTLKFNNINVKAICETFKCGKCDTTLISKHELNHHIQHEHEKSETVFMTEKKDKAPFQNMRNTILPFEPSKELKGEECNCNATTVGDFVKHTYAKEIPRMINPRIVN